ncbi:MAG: glycosyltransferase family 4 protein [Candidatus Diapherotrites archaeon]|nr:glycosyltransferase family 4 protein [Candidatus Diapherotrites archaeon]
MRILMLGWEFPPYVSGGLGRHCYELTRNLAANGVKVTFFMPKKGAHIHVPGVEIVGVSPKHHTTGRHASSKSWDIGPYPISPYALGPYMYSGPTTETHKPVSNGSGEALLETTENYPLNFFEAVQVYNKSVVREALGKKFDVIHAHDWITMPAAVELKERTGKPLIVTVHSTEYDRTANIYPMEWIVSIERKGIEKADRVIAVSKMTKDELVKKYGADDKKIRVIYNAVNPYEYKQPPQKKKEKMVLFAGRLTNQKGPVFFLRAAKEVLEHEKDPNVKFVVCGKGDLLPQLIEEAIHMGLTGKVMFTGYIPDDDLVRLYNMADVYVLPSVSEPFGITVLEAMAARTPVIISKTSGVSEVIKHCFKVDFWDTQEMANKIISILKHNSLKKCMTKNAEKEADRFDWDNVAKDTIKVYRELM